MNSAAEAHLEAHAHAHVHAHEHDGHDHGDRHQDHSAAAPAPVSLLRLSALERLVGALGLSALIWGAVWWALA